MAEILITNLQPEDGKSSLFVSLNETETNLLRSAIGRAVEARQIVGGAIASGSSLPDILPGPTMGYFPNFPPSLPTIVQ